MISVAPVRILLSVCCEHYTRCVWVISNYCQGSSLIFVIRQVQRCPRLARTLPSLNASLQPGICARANSRWPVYKLHMNKLHVIVATAEYSRHKIELRLNTPATKLSVYLCWGLLYLNHLKSKIITIQVMFMFKSTDTRCLNNGSSKSFNTL